MTDSTKKTVAKVTAKTTEAPKLNAAMKKVINNKDLSKSEKVRKFIDLGVGSPKFISDSIDMHYSHCVTVKRAYLKANPKIKKSLAS